MSKVGRRFPGVFQWGIALPSDAELLAGSRSPMGNDEFNGVFLFSLDLWRRRAREVWAMFRGFLIGG